MVSVTTKRPIDVISATTIAITIAIAAAMGYSVVAMPIWLVVAGAAAGAIVVTTNSSIMGKVLMPIIGLCVLGYMFFGRSFAYVGISPLFIGEALLGATILGAIVDKPRRGIHLSFLVMGSFFLWSLLLTVPYYRIYGLDVIHNAALYYYMTFAVIVFLYLDKRTIQSWLLIFQKCVPVLLWWYAITGIFRNRLVEVLPTVPGSDVSWITVKNGDRAVSSSLYCSILHLRPNSQAQNRLGSAGARHCIAICDQSWPNRWDQSRRASYPRRVTHGCMYVDSFQNLVPHCHVGSNCVDQLYRYRSNAF